MIYKHLKDTIDELQERNEGLRKTAEHNHDRVIMLERKLEKTRPLAIWRYKVRKIFLETDVNAILIARAESYSKGRAQTLEEPAEPSIVEDVSVIVSYANKEIDITDYIPHDLMSEIEDDLLVQYNLDKEVEENEG